MLGSAEVKPTEKEERTKILARRSVVALCDINQGELFDQNNIYFHFRWLRSRASYLLDN